MKCKATFRPPRIDVTAYRAKLKKHMTEKISEALYRYLEAALSNSSVGEMPTWSGGSRATFLRLARCIEYRIPINPVVPSREQQGEDQSVGSLDLDEHNTGRFTFTYGTNLPWLVTNENFNANAWGFRLKKPGPYQFQLAGIKAFEGMAKEVSLLPVYTTIKPIRVG